MRTPQVRKRPKLLFFSHFLWWWQFFETKNSYVSLNLLWHEFFLFRFVFHQNFILLFHFHFGGYYYFRSNWFNMVFGVYIYKFSVSVGFFFSFSSVFETMRFFFCFVSYFAVFVDLWLFLLISFCQEFPVISLNK